MPCSSDDIGVYLSALEDENRTLWDHLAWYQKIFELRGPRLLHEAELLAFKEQLEFRVEQEKQDLKDAYEAWISQIVQHYSKMLLQKEREILWVKLAGVDKEFINIRRRRSRKPTKHNWTYQETRQKTCTEKAQLESLTEEVAEPISTSGEDNLKLQTNL